MNYSFYVASAGVRNHQTHLDVISNNITNVNTNGYKSSTANFSDLLYENMSGVNPDNLYQGAGAKVKTTQTLFTPGFLQQTMEELDFAIEEDGFFALQNPQTGEIFYSRNGNFIRSETNNGYMLTSTEGYNVLDRNGNTINLYGNDKLQEQIGVYNFETKEGLMKVGQNMYAPTATNGQAYLMQNTTPVQGKLETSNVDLSAQMAKVIEAQRAFQFNIRMIQTTDETMQTINSLR